MYATVVLAVAALACSAVALAVVMNPSHEPVVEKYTLYVGLGEPTEEGAVKIQANIEELVARECGSGFTTYLASGGSLIDGKLVRDGYTAIFILTFVDGGTIPGLVEAINEELGIKAIMVEKQYAEETLHLF